MYVWKFGQAKACCDRCGFDYRLEQLRKEWTGLKVCDGCFDYRNPQDFVRGVPDRQAVQDPRPEPPPTFVVQPVNFAAPSDSQYIAVLEDDE